MNSTFVIVGPTASGKSDVALELAVQTGGEIVNADSRQIYKGFDAGTSKPSLADRQKVPHHLYDFLNPDQTYNAGQYCKDAENAIQGIHSRGKPAIVVGGTGLYIRAYFLGMAELPPMNEPIRKKLSEFAAQQGRKALHDRLALFDPESAKKIPYQNIQRLIRALEVYELTKKPLSAHHAETPRKTHSNPTVFFGLLWNKAALKERINFRCGNMAKPMLEEVREHLNKGVPESSPAFQSLGYRSALEHVSGKISYDAFVQSLSADTLQYAKRQMTWFRKDPEILWIKAENPFDPSATAREIKETLWKQPS